jgi:uncharacterized protein
MEHKLKAWFENHPKTITALSGGVDSTLLAYLARKYNGKANAPAVIGVSPSLKQKDLELSYAFCKLHDIKLIEVSPGEINNANYASNPVNRCYYCKSALYSAIQDLADKKFRNFSILNGNNYSDLGDYRPGQNAAKEMNVFSPFMECGISKANIRELANTFGLETWNKPASPCLSSRIAYGEVVTVDKLQKIEAAEDALLEAGFSNVRVRIINEEASIEVEQKEVETLNTLENLNSIMANSGFKVWSINQNGFKSGRFNEKINSRLKLIR